MILFYNFQTMKDKVKIAGIIAIIVVAVYLVYSVYGQPENVQNRNNNSGPSVVSLEEEYKSTRDTLSDLEKKLARAKIAQYTAQLDVEAKTDKPQYLKDRAGLKTELKRLTEKVGEKWQDVYRVPEDLFYTFLVTDNAYVTQTPRQHFANNGFLATDVATAGQAIPVYVPDYLNQELEYLVSYEDFKETTGKAVILTSGNVRWLLGHVVIQEQREKVRTGDRIGVVGCTEGVTTGCHVHIQLFMRANESSKWQSAEYLLGNSNKPEVIQDRVKEEVEPQSMGKIKATSYNPSKAQTDSSPCVGASGVDLCEEIKKGVRIIALSQDLVGRSGKKYKYGDKITIKSDLDDTRCNGEFTVLDTMNARYTNRADLFFMDKKDNVSCNITIL